MVEAWLARWKAAESQWVIHRAILIDLPAVATEAMVAGWDSHSLRLLAGASPRTDVRELSELFLASVHELDRALPSEADAARHLTAFYAAKIIRGEISPELGARAIAGLGYDLPIEVLDDIVYLGGLDDEWIGGWGRTRDEVENAIVETAKNIVERRR